MIYGTRGVVERLIQHEAKLVGVVVLYQPLDHVCMRWLHFRVGIT